MKLNNKGISIIEIVFTFALIMVIVISMLTVVFNYREKANLSLEKLKMDTFKNTLTREIQDDILDKGVKEINSSGECLTNTELNSCVNIVFLDDSEKTFGTGKVNPNDRDSIENKFLYYDGIKYGLSDTLPTEIPKGRNAVDFQMITIYDTGILGTDSMILEDGTIVTLYSIDVYITHANFDQDFGIHIVAYSEKSERDV